MTQFLRRACTCRYISPGSAWYAEIGAEPAYKLVAINTYYRHSGVKQHVDTDYGKDSQMLEVALLEGSTLDNCL